MEGWYNKKFVTGTVDIGVYPDRQRTERYPKGTRELLGREPTCISGARVEMVSEGSSTS